jgi:hypothetical protein
MLGNCICFNRAIFITSIRFLRDIRDGAAAASEALGLQRAGTCTSGALGAQRAQEVVSEALRVPGADRTGRGGAIGMLGTCRCFTLAIVTTSIRFLNRMENRTANTNKDGSDKTLEIMVQCHLL